MKNNNKSRKIKIEVGCGRKFRKGYLHCDIRKLPYIDYVCAADKLPFKNGAVDEIYSRHLIEHFSLIEVIKVLEEWNRVLKIKGKIYIICPNLLWHLRQILKGSHKSFYIKKRGENNRYWGFGSLFGWQQDDYDVHKFGYYFTLLKDLLEECGFGKVKNYTNKPDSLEKASWHLEVEAEKIKSPKKNNKFKNVFNIKH
ncbi:MAG: methyltransferase domain-containing protein [Candidatus Niyogibacteria bacterium]|nr:methyltransferase domain-containing protein [Candidatus Niyogibacteria bacterium]